MKLEGKPAERDSWLTLPNGLTLFRFLLIPFFLSELIQGRRSAALLIFLLASLTDLLDGFVARTWNVRTTLGRIIDPAADKLLLVSAFIFMTFPRFSQPFSMPVWLTATVMARDSLIALGALILFIWKGMKNFSPSLPGKICTFLQAITVLLVLAANALAEQQFFHRDLMEKVFSLQVQSLFFWLTFGSTIVSGIHYTAFGLKKGFFSS